MINKMICLKRNLLLILFPIRCAYSHPSGKRVVAQIQEQFFYFNGNKGLKAMRKGNWKFLMR